MDVPALRGRERCLEDRIRGATYEGEAPIYPRGTKGITTAGYVTAEPKAVRVKSAYTDPVEFGGPRRGLTLDKSISRPWT